MRDKHPIPFRGLRQDGDHSWGLVAVLVALAISVAWSYWPILAGLSSTLRTSDDYSAGQLVPFVAALFIWRDRKALRELPLISCWWGGIPLLVLAEGARIYGYLSMRQSIEQYAVVLALGGLALVIAGWQFFWRVSHILLFLFLMMPLPNMIHSRVSPPLQRVATTGSVFLLEAVGVPVSQQGNVILLKNEMPMAVAEACSGLRMLTAFIIVAAFIAYMVKRPRWHKAILLASSIPVAVACNIIRIFLTAMIMLYVSVELGEHFFHDFAGLVMMPVAVSLIFAEIWLLDRIVTPDEKESSSPSDANSKSGGHPAVIHARRVAK